MGLDVSPEMVESATRSEGGMEHLLKSLWPHAYRIARSIAQNDTVAQDAAQEACAAVYRDVGKLRSASAFKPWFYRIVAREAVRASRRSSLSLVPVASHTLTNGDVDSKIDVSRAIDALPPDLKIVVVLHYYADLTSSEIGSALQIPSATVRFRLVRARSRIKAALDVPDVVQKSREVSV